MDIRDWTVALIEPNKFEAQIVFDLLRAAGCQRVRRFADSREALVALELYPANIILMEVESAPLDGPEWTKAFRRERRAFNRKAAVFLLSHAVSRSLAETCRHAGANAIIGKPISGSTLLATIKKVIANPRPFIDAEGYVGPCRRAGIVTAGPARRRRRSDTATAKPALPPLPLAVGTLASAVEDVLHGRTTNVTPSEMALRSVQMIVTESGDTQMMRASAEMALLLASHRPGADYLATLRAVTGTLVKLATMPANETAAREALIEAIRAAVAKIAAKEAA